MPATYEATWTGLFDQAVQSFGEALKAGVKAQEQVVGFWTDAVSKGAAGDYQKKAQGAFNDAIPAVQKTTEDYLRLVDVNYRKGIEALKKACDVGATVTPAEFQAKAQ